MEAGSERRELGSGSSAAPPSRVLALERGLRAGAPAACPAVITGREEAAHVGVSGWLPAHVQRQISLAVSRAFQEIVLPAELQAGRCKAALSRLPSSRSPGLQDVCPQEGSGQVRGPPNAHAGCTRRVNGRARHYGAGQSGQRRGWAGAHPGRAGSRCDCVAAWACDSCVGCLVSPREVSLWPSPPTLYWFPGFTYVI